MQGNFLDELTFPLSSNYYHTMQDVGGKNPGKLELAFFSFASPAVCVVG